MARLVFIGTARFAVPSLCTLADHHEVTGVVTQRDRRAGRGNKLTSTPTKLAAEELNLPVITPTNVNESTSLRQISSWKPDLIIVSAYGQILTQQLLDIPLSGCLNVHASLLPRHRGAAPVAAAILAGDSHTGVTIMKMDAGMDTGPVLSKLEIKIHAQHTTESLTAELSKSGSHLLLQTIPDYLSKKLLPQPQDDALATYSPSLKKSDGKLNFQNSADELERQVRAMHPWPGAFTYRSEQPLKVLEAQATSGKAKPGQVLISSGRIAVGTGKGLLYLKQLQPPGKRPMTAEDYARGSSDFVGDTLE